VIEPTLNERSIELAETPTTDRITALIAVLRRLDALGFSRILRHARDALERQVEAGTSLRTWILRKAPRDTRQFLAGRLDKAPFVEELHRRREATSGFLLQVTYEGAPAVGAGIAHLHDTPAVALGGLAAWEVDPLVVVLTKMDEEEGVLVEMAVPVVHLCRPEQIDARARLLRDRVLRAVSGGDDLWGRRLELFPRLDFCAEVERQMRGLSGKEFYFQHVVLALSRLDAALAEWIAGPLHPGMDHSAESTSTLAHGTYGPLRDFVCMDNEPRRFSHHLKLFSINWRIYYWEVRVGAAGGRAHVGYIGVHLPTVKYRT
jgi:hypothetical protein